MKTPPQLLKNVIGQLSGIEKMILENQDCFQVLTQMKAAKAALDSTMNRYIEENLMQCMKNKKDASAMSKRLFQELIKNN
jgi:DNA-binding FrmR family transcriptional regulator